MMRVLALCAGTGSLEAAFRDRGHEVISLDSDPAFGCTLTMDVREFARDPEAFLPKGWIPDLVIDGTPCTTFSVASIGHHWTGGARAYEPKTAGALIGMQVAQAGVQVAMHFGCRFVFENPRGVLRKLGIMPGEPKTVWLCRYGDKRAKPTDIWTDLPWTPRPPCHNGHPDHEAAPRGAKTGTQGVKGAVARAVMPYALSLELCLAAERAIQSGGA